ncbi:MAG: histidine phosphatase family protein [Alphaproteobacteria bacterium]|nr:histidine phosphatase family protein [Alphaproteobacteria bacterium]
MIPARPFYMLRHGQSEANMADVIAGRGVDSPLTAQGRNEAETVRSTLSQLGYSTPSHCS